MLGGATVLLITRVNAIMRWAIEIRSTSLEHRSLGDLLAGLGFTLFDGIQSPAFTSPDIDRCNAAAQVFDIAKRVRTAFGSAQIDPTLDLGFVIDYSTTPPRRHGILEVQPMMFYVTLENVTLTVSPPSGLSAEELEKWNKDQTEKDYQARLEDQRARLEPAYREPRAAKVLELLSLKEPTGETLYKIYELAEGHPSNRNAFHSQLDISKNDFSRFSDAVHNPGVSGDWARHAYHDVPKTDNPMSRTEAEQFVCSIAKRWLAHLRANSTP